MKLLKSLNASDNLLEDKTAEIKKRWTAPSKADFMEFMANIEARHVESIDALVELLLLFDLTTNNPGIKDKAEVVLGRSKKRKTYHEDAGSIVRCHCQGNHNRCNKKICPCHFAMMECSEKCRCGPDGCLNPHGHEQKLKDPPPPPRRPPNMQPRHSPPGSPNVSSNAPPRPDSFYQQVTARAPKKNFDVSEMKKEIDAMSAISARLDAVDKKMNEVGANLISSTDAKIQLQKAKERARQYVDYCIHLEQQLEDKEDKEDNHSDCIICQEQPATWSTTGCGHLLVCSECVHGYMRHMWRTERYDYTNIMYMTKNQLLLCCCFFDVKFDINKDTNGSLVAKLDGLTEVLALPNGEADDVIGYQNNNKIYFQLKCPTCRSQNQGLLKIFSL